MHIAANSYNIYSEKTQQKRFNKLYTMKREFTSMENFSQVYDVLMIPFALAEIREKPTTKLFKMFVKGQLLEQVKECTSWEATFFGGGGSISEVREIVILAKKPFGMCKELLKRNL